MGSIGKIHGDKIVTRPAKKGIMEDDEAKTDLDKIKGKILETEIQLGQISDERFDLKEAIDYCFDFLLHIPEYWQKGTFQQKKRLLSSIFSKRPSYFYPKFESKHLLLDAQQSHMQ
jgi:hypothetical protein